MEDTRAQSCLWSMTGFLAAGFTPSDLIPVSLDLVAANKSPIKIAGAIILRLQLIPPTVIRFHAPPWSTSVRPRGLLPVIGNNDGPRDCILNFPSDGAAADPPPVTQQPPTISIERHDSLTAGGLAQTANSIDSCSYPPRTVVPVRPVALSLKLATPRWKHGCYMVSHHRHSTPTHTARCHA